MRIGIISDTHDNLAAIDKAMTAMRSSKVEAVIHCGDFVAPFAMKLILKHVRAMDVPFFAVFGNNDGEHHGLSALWPELSKGPLHIELDERKLVVVHDVADLTHEDEFSADVVISGHTHLEPVNELRDGRLYLNPGECCGWLTGECRIMILQTRPLAAESVTVMHQERPQ